MAKDVALKSNVAMVHELGRFNAPQATERPQSKRQRDDVDRSQWQHGWGRGDPGWGGGGGASSSSGGWTFR